MKLVIAIPHRFALWDAPQWFSERLRAEFPDLQVAHLSNYDTLEREIADADIALCRELKPRQVQAAQKLRWIHSAAAAVHPLMIPEIRNSAILVTNASAVHGPVVAEQAMAMIMAIARRFDIALKAQTHHQWKQEESWVAVPPPRDIAGSTLVVVGLGKIGTPLVQHAKALGHAGARRAGTSGARNGRRGCRLSDVRFDEDPAEGRFRDALCASHAGHRACLRTRAVCSHEARRVHPQRGTWCTHRRTGH